jgi:hypothetical protein
MSEKLTTQDVWISTLIFGVMALVLLVPLYFIFTTETFQRALKHYTAASAIFWGVLAIVFMNRYWELYYQYLYPTWVRPLAPLSMVVYAAFGIGLWWLASRLEISPILGFSLLGGVQGMAEHLFAIYFLHILDKVPFLEGLQVFPVTVFSFFEYTLYWTLVGWLALGFVKLFPP